MNSPFPGMSGMGQTITDMSKLPPGLAEAIRKTRLKETTDADITDVVPKEPKKDTVSLNELDQNPDIGEPAQSQEATKEVTPQKPAHDLREELTIEIGQRSPVCPPPATFIGTSKVESNYARWLDKQIGECMNKMASPTASTKMKAGQFMYAVCYMALAEDWVKKLTYRWVGPRPPRGLKVEEVLKDFVLRNKNILLTVAPYYGVMPEKITGRAPDAPVEETVPAVPAE